ncbi:MAG: ABC transporter permease [Bacteroidales bacterium]|nr:ABC transporter permease [Bacteroidales bacterium]
MIFILNIIGLSVALAIFLAIVIQVNYHLNFNKSIKNSENIFTLTIEDDNHNKAIMPRGIADRISDSNPHIKNLSFGWFYSDKQKFNLVDGDKLSESFYNNFYPVTKSFFDTFSFEILEGDLGNANDPNSVIIPQSVADLFSQNGSVIGKNIRISHSKNYVIVGVYKDFKDNTMVNNHCYTFIPDTENLNDMNNWNYTCFMTLDSKDNIEEVLSSINNMEFKY